MANISKNRPRAPSTSAARAAAPKGEPAPGRLQVGAPVAIIDIGSNSVRLVAYEGLTRSPTPIFNEKVLCGLGKGVATTHRLNPDAMAKALTALRRFRVLCKTMGVMDMSVLATAAARDADNGAEFLKAARGAIGAKIELLSGTREAELSALGVVSAFHNPDGVVGDLGGGSLELVDVKGTRVARGVSLRLGGLSLMDMSGRSPKKAVKIVRQALRHSKQLEKLHGRTFYAVGGTWRALARLHMTQRHYPLNVMHGYVIPARDVIDFASLVERVDSDALISIGAVASQRRPLLAYGAAVIEEIVRIGRPKEVVVSALGVREGLLFERLSAKKKLLDPLLSAAREMNMLRSRAPQHGEDLCAWTDGFMRSTHFEERGEDVRLRHAACLLADIGWRAHPDYRGEQSQNIITHAAFIGIDHPGRAWLGLAASYRHLGLDADVSPQTRILVSARMLDRARVLGAAMRVAYIVSAAMPGVLPRTPLRCGRDMLTLKLPRDLSALASDRLNSRLKQLGRLIGRNVRISVAG